MKLQHRFTTGLLLSLALMLAGINPVSSNSGGKFIQFTSSKIPGRIGTIGYVFQDGHPVLAEYDSEGKWVSDLGWEDSYANADILSGKEYRAALQLYVDYMANDPEEARGARFVTAEAYKVAHYQTSIPPLVDVHKPALREGTRSVLIAAENSLVLSSSKLVLMEFPILMDENTRLEEGIVSLLINKADGQKGQILKTSRYQIGYKVDAYSNREALRDQPTVRLRDYELVSPLKGIEVTGSIDWEDIQDTSDENGDWLAAIDPELYCSFGMIDFSVYAYVTAKVPYRNFNPKKSSAESLFRPVLGGTYKNCTYVMVPYLPAGTIGGATEDAIASIIATIAQPVVDPVEILVSTMKVNAIGELKNPTDKLSPQAADIEDVALDAETLYFADDSITGTSNPNLAHYDFDGDGVDDNVRINPSNPNMVDVYLDRNPDDVDANGDPIQPYFTRLADPAFAIDDAQATAQNPTPGYQNLHQGLLKSISQADLEDTDIYFYRQSTGDLVGHIEGLVEGGTAATDPSQSENAGIVYTSYNGVSSYRGVHTDSANAKFGFSSLLLGTRTQESKYFARQSLINGGDSNRDEDFANAERKPWVERYNDQAGSATDFADRKVDFLIPGEKIKIVAINRKTGYIGTRITQLGGPDQNQDSMDIPDETGQLERKIILYPPNLKINVTRDYKITEGLYKHDPDESDRTFLIGSEGAGLTSDTAIAIQTVWLDENGSPLPDSLPGYTARIAISTGDATKGVSENYEVKPGIHTGVIQLPGGLATAAKHYYVQLVGENKDGNPDFTSFGAGTGKLTTRPKYYVPVMVPIYNEAATREQQNALRDAKADGTAPADAEVNPEYDWVYRPEMMFSVFDMKMKQILNERAGEQSVDIYPAGADDSTDTTPMLASGYDAVRLLFDLQQQQESELTRFSGDRQLVFAVGEEELLATYGDDQQLVFDNPDHMALLDVEDYLSIRLVMNNDANNVLWEFAFEYLALDTRWVGYGLETEDRILVSADDPIVPMQAILVGYANRAEDAKTPISIHWQMDGQGSTNPQTENNFDSGAFASEVTMPTTAGATGTLISTLNTADGALQARSKIIQVIPGAPANIDIQMQGRAVVMEKGELTANIIVTDLHGNRVADGTNVIFSVSDDALISSDAVETLNGQASVTITGSAFSSDTALLTVAAGSAVQTQSFIIYPLTIQLTADATINTRQSMMVSALVTTPDGVPVADADVTFSATRGMFRNNEILTDGQGVATVEYFSGLRAGDASLQVRVGYTGRDDQALVIVDPASVALNVDDAFVIGDASADGSVSYTRYDGTLISMEYYTSGTVAVSGTGEQTVALGDIADPNLAPLLAFYMNELDEIDTTTGNYIVNDEVGLYNGITARNVEIASDNPLGGGSSYRFNGYGQITVVPDANLSPVNSVGFRFDIKPESSNAMLLNHGAGTHTVKLVNDRLVYSILTADGTFSLTSSVITQNSWHTVAGRYHNGNLELSVDGQVTTTAATGNISWSIGGITLAAGYTGLMNSFRLYDWNSQPLLSFSDGTQDLVLPTGAGNITVQSTGQMNARTNAQLGMLRVAITAGDNRNYISLMSQEAFKTIAAEYTDSYDRNAPPIVVHAFGESPNEQNLANLGGQVLDFLVPPAHAAFWDSWSDAWNALKEGVSWIVPYEDFKRLGEQLYYLATDDARYNARELMFAALGVATVIPIMKPLKPFLNPIRNFVSRFADRPIIRHLGGVLGQATSEAFKGRTEKLLSLLPFLLIVAEVATEPGADAVFSLLVNSIDSADDVWTWIDYLALPTDGWEGTSPPKVEVTEAEMSGTDNYSPIDFIIPRAHAVQLKAARIVASKMVLLARETTARLSHRFGAGDYSELMSGIKNLTQAMKNTDLASIRKFLHDPRALAASVAVGGQALRKLLKKTGNLRMSPLAMLVTIAYIESRRGDCTDLVGCRPFIAQVRDKIPSLYLAAFLDALDGDKDYVGNRENGAMFHLAMIAVKHLEYEVSGNAADQIIRIEQERPVQLYAKDGPGAIRPLGSTLKRRVDIMLAGNSTGSEPDEGNIWIEVKSLKQTPGFNGWSRWNMANRKGTSNHRQYYLDRVASTDNPLRNWVGTDKVASDYQWWLQDFQRKKQNIRSYNKTELKKIHEKVRVLPNSAGNGESYSSVGKTRADYKQPLVEVQAKLQLFNVKTWLLNNARTRLLDGIDADAIKELIEDSSSF